MSSTSVCGCGYGLPQVKVGPCSEATTNPPVVSGLAVLGAAGLMMAADESGTGGEGEASSDPYASGYALVTELPDMGDPSRHSGVFTAHWESGSDFTSIENPEDVPIAQALEWARDHSDAVIVQVGGGSDGRYSAGSRTVSDEGIMPWPADGLNVAARPEGSALDGSEQIVPWATDVRVTLLAHQRALFVAALDANERIQRAMESEDGGTIEVVTRGSGIHEVARELHGLLSAALTEAAPGRSLSDAGVGISNIRRPQDPGEVSEDARPGQ